MCDFNGFKAPEMVKRRPVLVIGTKPSGHRLVTIICLSSTEPNIKMNYHLQLDDNQLPRTKFFNGGKTWVKADMIYTLSFDRLNLILLGRGANGQRKYFQDRLGRNTMKEVYKCVLNGLHIGSLSSHL